MGWPRRLGGGILIGLTPGAVSGEQPLEAEPVLGSGSALALILVDDENAFGWPTELNGPIYEGVLAVGGFPILGDLLRGRLADVDYSQPVEMPGLDLGGD